MQLSDVLNLSDAVIIIVWSAIMLFSGEKAILMGKTFAAQEYRSRAYWLATLLIVLPVDGLPFFFLHRVINEIDTVNAIKFVFTLGFLIIVYIFVDRNLNVMRQIDFFHRDAARWTSFRRIGLVLLFAYLVIFAAELPAIIEGTSSMILIIGDLLVVGISLGWASVALLIAARRTPDKTMRNFTKLLGIALALGVAAESIWVPFNAAGFLWLTKSDIDTDILLLFASYFLYRAVMSLSLVGKIEKATAIRDFEKGKFEGNYNLSKSFRRKFLACLRS